MDEGLEQSRILLLCISPNALASGWVALERSTAIHRDPANEDRRFIPLMLADCELPDTLRRYKYVDFREEAEARFGELLAVCRSDSEEAASLAKPPQNGGAPKEMPQAVQSANQAEPLAMFERKLTGHTDWVRSVAVSPDGKWAASGSEDQTIRIWDLETGECRATLEGHGGEVYSVAITPDGQRVLSASKDGSVRIWEPRLGLAVAKMEGHLGRALSVAAFEDNVRAISGGLGTTLRLWDIPSSSCLKAIECEGDAREFLVCICVNRAGTHALSGHSEGLCRYWSIETGECVATFKGHSGGVNSVLITADGRFAVSGSEDTTVKIWDLAGGTCLGTLEGHESIVMSVAISPDGTVIASTGIDDQTVRLWGWYSMDCLQVIRLEGAGLVAMGSAFSPDGSRLVVGSAGAEIHVFRLTGVRPVVSAGATRRYVNAKVVLLGEGTVGKTSLAHRLIEDNYVIRDRTHGMSIWPLPLPLPPDATLEREALLWDLAGQEDYRLIHQLFLEETALALLLINPQKDNPLAEAGDWLKALKTAAGNHGSKREAARLAIFSQVDVGEPKLGSTKLDRFCQENGLENWLVTSAKNGRNCSDQENGGQPSKLKRLIASSIP